MKTSKTKSKIKHFKSFQKFCQVACLFAFLAWFAKAVQDWAAWSTSTKWDFLYGDDDDDLVRYPVLTFCNLPYFNTEADIYYWKDYPICRNNSEGLTSPPYFLSYLEDCLKANESNTVPDLIDQVTYEIEEMVTGAYTSTPLVFQPPLNNSEVWRNLKDDFISSTYDFNYGHCINLDIGQLSKQNGKFPVKVGVDGAKLFLKVFINEKIDHTLKYLFLRGEHGLIDVNAFGLTIFQSQKLTIRKKRIESLPTKARHCNPTDYQTCVKDVFNQNTLMNYDCYLPFLGNSKSKNYCPRNVTLKIIQELKLAIHLKQFENCTNHKPCNSVIYTVLDRQIQKWGFGNNYVEIGFNDLLVEVIKDSYVHTFISIFSEIGGSLGVLVGVSCMSVVEFMINIYTNLCSK